VCHSGKDFGAFGASLLTGRLGKSPSSRNRLFWRLKSTHEGEFAFKKPEPIVQGFIEVSQDKIHRVFWLNKMLDLFKVDSCA